MAPRDDRSLIVPAWRIFYADESTYSNSDGPPRDAPTVGVIVIVQDWCNPPQVLHQTDFYWWRDGIWRAGDIYGFLDQAARYGATWVKQGETIHAEEYQAIMARAVALKDDWSS